jgi:uncharacterized protein YabE (DUF348 family)
LTERLLSPARAAGAGITLRIYPGQVALLLAALLLGGFAWLFVRTERPVTLNVNGLTVELATHQQTVAALLAEYHYQLDPADIVLPPLDTPLAQASAITVYPAQPIEVAVDGATVRFATQAGSVGDVLDSIGVRLQPADRLWALDDYLSPNTLLADLHPAPINLRQPREPLRLSVIRAVPIYLSDDGVAATVQTYAHTVAEVLRENDFRVHTNDLISPDLGQYVNPGLRILIERSKPVTIRVDGKSFQAHTRERTIGAMLTEAGIRLQGKDYTRPAVGTLLTDNMQVQVVRVREEILEQATPIAFAKLVQPDDNLEIDQQELRQKGQNGEHRKQIRVTYEDGQEIQRALEKEWDSKKPVPQITAYGRKIVMRTLDTPQGPLQYWRVVRMYASSYSPARSGVSPDKSWYGHTFSGLPAGKGVIAVDKSVVPWLSRLYIEGYGIGTAGDTGNGVVGKLIDLGFDDANYEGWHQWVDAYWLWPPPDPRTIRWQLPNVPVERLR